MIKRISLMGGLLFLGACAVQSFNEGATVKADSGGSVVACELSMVANGGKELTNLQSRSCNDLEVESARERNLVTGLCQLASSATSLSYRILENRCDSSGAIAVCLVGNQDGESGLIQKTYYYHGDNASDADKLADLAQFNQSCMNLSGRLETPVQ